MKIDYNNDIKSELEKKEIVLAGINIGDLIIQVFNKSTADQLMILGREFNFKKIS